MNLLTRLCRQSCFINGLRCRPSTGIRSVHGVPSCKPFGSLAAAATKDSRWVMLDEAVRRKIDSVVADAKTMAESPTSTGHNLRIYFDRAAPPASSSLYHDWAGSAPSAEEYAGEPEIIAAHGDSVLFEMNQKLRRLSNVTSDYFVYRAGAARPPSLSLLPAIPSCGTLNKWKTGILRRGDDELLVVQLDLVTKRRETAHLCVLQLSRREWELKPEVPIVLDKVPEYYDGHPRR
ncbi:hypothetical protein ACP70R_004022 [Stipagrostis hirtigluma subsp. patula]